MATRPHPHIRGRSRGRRHRGDRGLREGDLRPRPESRRPGRHLRLAERLGVSPGTVTAMLKRMAEAGLVGALPGVALSPAGEQVALEVIRHHRLLESYLADALGMPWDKVHDEAEVLEHYISEDLEERIAAALGDPSRDPHGDPIPDRALGLADDSAVALSRLGPGETGIFTRVSDSTRRCCVISIGAASAGRGGLGSRGGAVRGRVDDRRRRAGARDRRGARRADAGQPPPRRGRAPAYWLRPWVWPTTSSRSSTRCRTTGPTSSATCGSATRTSTSTPRC